MGIELLAVCVCKTSIMYVNECVFVCLNYNCPWGLFNKHIQMDQVQLLHVGSSGSLIFDVGFIGVMLRAGHKV